jgi:hypothetical protein
MQIQDSPSLDQVLNYHKRRRKEQGIREPQPKFSSETTVPETPNSQEAWDWSETTLEPYGYSSDPETP